MSSDTVSKLQHLPYQVTYTAHAFESQEARGDSSETDKPAALAASDL